MNTGLSWGLAVYVAEWILRLTMIVVISRQRRSVTAMAWLLVVFFQPWIGLPLYFIFGTIGLPRRRIAEHAQLLKELRAVRDQWEVSPHIVRPEVDENLKPTVTLAQRLGDMPIVGGNAAETMTQTDQVIDRLIADIDAARTHVHLLYYMFADDATGQRVAEALARAAKRGVKCRLLVDAVASRPLFRKLGRQMRRDGIQVQADLSVHLLRRQFGRVDMRNHRKVAVIDGDIAYAGSQNIVNADYGHKDLIWHDMTLRLTGPIVLELQEVFVIDWYFATNELLKSEDVFHKQKPSGELMAQVLPSGPNYATENFQCMVVSALQGARRQIVITTPYLIPDEPFFQAIQTAVLRGVQVRFIVPRRCDQVLVGAAMRGYYGEILAAGAEVFLYPDGLLHAKTMIVDDSLAFVGSSNFDIRSFALNLEVNVLCYGPEMNKTVRAEQDKYQADSTQLTLEQWKSQPAWRQAWWNIARLLSPLL